MDVFIGNLPSQLSFKEIRELHGSWDFNAPIKRVDGQDKSGHEFHYFLAQFSPKNEAEAEQLIQEMKGISIYGQVLDVREFIHRSYCNERRALNWRKKPWHNTERRAVERRKSEH